MGMCCGKRMIAAFGSGTAFSLVSGMAGPQPLMGAFSTGVVFALLQGGLFKVCHPSPLLTICVDYLQICTNGTL